MTDRLQSSEDFFNLVLKPNYDEYASQGHSFQRLINCLETLFHIHEWVFEHDRTYAESTWGVTLSSKWDVWNYIQQNVPLAKYVRDNANSAKHVKLTKNPSTGAHFFANTAITTGGYDSGGFDKGAYDTGGFSVDEAGSTVNLDQAIKDTFEFWRSFMEQKTHGSVNPTP